MATLRSINDQGMRVFQLPLGLFSMCEASVLLGLTIQELLVAGREGKMRFLINRPDMVSVLCVERMHDRNAYMTNKFSRPVARPLGQPRSCGSVQPEYLVLAPADCDEILTCGYSCQRQYYACACVDASPTRLDIIRMDPISFVPLHNTIVDRYFLTVSKARLKYDFFMPLRTLSMDITVRSEQIFIPATDLIDYTLEET